MSQILTYEDFQKWGSLGGSKSHRVLSSEQARNMGLKSAKVRTSMSSGQLELQPSVKLPYGTKEWASHNVNIQQGCEHNCKYCYAKSMAIRFKRSTAKNWTTTKLRDNELSRYYTKKNGTVMYPTTHDITPRNVDAYISVLQKLLCAGNNVLVVSKPHLSCVKKICSICADYKHRILFRFTIGSTDNSILQYWEPDAPGFQERLSALQWAHAQGYKTSVSVEPMLDTNMDNLISAVKPYVTDAIWLGRVNQIKSALAQNCPKDIEAKLKADDLLKQQSDEWLIELYEKYRKDKLIKWKDSIKKVAGIHRPIKSGLDI